MPSQQEVMNHLENEPVDVWMAWMESSVSAVRMDLAPDIVFQQASLRANANDSIEWATVALRAAEIGAQNKDPSIEESYKRWIIILRTKWILRCGERSGDRLLDIEALLPMLIEGVTESFESVQAKTNDWQNRVQVLRESPQVDGANALHEDLKMMRRLRVRLTAAKSLDEQGRLPEGSILHRWLPLLPSLP